MAHPPFREMVLLVEFDAITHAMRVRPVVMERPGIHEITTMMRVSPEAAEVAQLFRCTNSERDLAGRFRVFREVVEVIAEKPETPLYDEMKIIFTDEVSKPTIF